MNKLLLAVVTTSAIFLLTGRLKVAAAATAVRGVPLTDTSSLSVTPTGTFEPTPTGVPQENITQTTETKGRLERVIEERTIGSLSPTNVVQFAIRRAVDEGVPANTIVLLLLFPVVATLVAAARHFLGLRGFGVFTPALIAVTFLATGLQLGLTLFITIILIATIGRVFLRRLHLQYLPQMAQLILVISLGIIGILLVSPMIVASTGTWLGMDRLISIGIFPVLILTLLTETFINAQILHGVRRAATMTAETVVLASLSYLLMNIQTIQEWVVTNPEVTIIAVAATNVAVGRFTGLRLLELWRFRELLKK